MADDSWAVSLEIVQRAADTLSKVSLSPTTINGNELMRLQALIGSITVCAGIARARFTTEQIQKGRIAIDRNEIA